MTGVHGELILILRFEIRQPRLVLRIVACRRPVALRIDAFRASFL